MSLDAYREFVRSRSLTELLVVVAVVAVVAWYAVGGVSNWWDNRVALQEVERLQAESQKAQAEAKRHEQEAQQQKGVAEDAKQDAKKAKQEAQDAREQARAAQDALHDALARAGSARTRFEQTRRAPRVRAGTLDERAKRLESDLDNALSDNPRSDP